MVFYESINLNYILGQLKNVKKDCNIGNDIPYFDDRWHHRSYLLKRSHVINGIYSHINTNLLKQNNKETHNTNGNIYL